MNPPLGYLLTWTTYGTWLPGDARGWVDGRTHELHPSPDPERERQGRERMREEAITLTPDQRNLVTTTIHDHCRIRRWELHAVNVRSNHASTFAGFLNRRTGAETVGWQKK